MCIFKIENHIQLYFGEGAVNSLKDCIKDLGSKALIVTGKNSARKSGLLQKVINIMETNNKTYVPFEKITPNPLSSTINEGVELAKQNGCDFIIGIGGGSAIDAAKAIALCAVNEGDITGYQPGGQYANVIPEKALPIVAITTTAGTGTEINRYLVITNTKTKGKPGIGFDCTYPTVSIVDPELMLHLPKEISIDTGLDVLFHALEAYISIQSNMFSDILSKEAVQLVVNNLEEVLKDTHNIKARRNMAWANTLAGWAIDIAGTVAIHGAGHPISGHFNAIHGQSLAALSVAYMKQNYSSNPQKFADLTCMLGYENDELTADQLAAKSSDALKQYLQRFNRDISISSLGATKDHIDQLVEDVFATMEGALLNNPRQLTKEDIKKLYLESL